MDDTSVNIVDILLSFVSESEAEQEKDKQERQHRNKDSQDSELLNGSPPRKKVKHEQHDRYTSPFINKSV